MTGKYKQESLADYKTFEKNSQYKELKDIAHTCVRMTKKGNPGGAFYTCIIESPHPHIYLLEASTETKADDVPFLEVYDKTIPELLEIQEKTPFSTLPLRRAMIYSGNKANTLAVEKQRTLLKSQNKNYSEWFLQQEFGKLSSHLSELFQQQDYYTVMENSLEAMSIKLLHLFTEIYKQ